MPPGAIVVAPRPAFFYQAARGEEKKLINRNEKCVTMFVAMVWIV